MTDKPRASKPAGAGSKTKADTVKRLVSREKGATIEELIKTTEWQPHSCRAFLTGLRKKGHVITREDRDGKTAYRMAATVPGADVSSAPS
ncbi:DUF3489 domain-containing protein, partial [Pseudorhodoplanes sp.]|uniref:DUF3489 domain-containing protein n=1 Tax=Pseudorhodoplanes sp. TaxID=1934341 RepID=UPI003D14472C